METFEIKNLDKNKNILLEKQQLLGNMVDPNVRRGLQLVCVVPSEKKKTTQFFNYHTYPTFPLEYNIAH